MAYSKDKKVGIVPEGQTIASMARQLCQHIIGKLTDQLLIRPLDIYEIPQTKSLKKVFDSNSTFESILKLTPSTHFLYKSNQKIKSSKTLNLVSNIFELTQNYSTTNDTNIKFKIEPKSSLIKFLIEENIYLPNYLPAHLKYTNIKSCLLIEAGQYIDAYTTLGYFESISPNSIEIVKLKSKYKNNREILLISKILIDASTISCLIFFFKSQSCFLCIHPLYSRWPVGKLMVKCC